VTEKEKMERGAEKEIMGMREWGRENGDRG